jgi:hypothetical protein
MSHFAALCAANLDRVGGRTEAGAGWRVRRHHSRKVSGAGAGSSRDFVHAASGPGAREIVRPGAREIVPAGAFPPPFWPPSPCASGRLAARASFCARS